MNQRRIGQSDLHVSSIGLGCMGMTFAYGPVDDVQNLKTLDRALELGVTLLDTAEIYGPWKNETLLGNALVGRRDKVVLATKFAWRLGDAGERGPLDGSRANMRRALEGSLKRLKTDRIDLFYQHRLDPNVPIEETVGAMAELVKEGKVRAIGLSEVGAATIRRAHAVFPIAAVQSEYSLWETGVEEHVVPALKQLGVSLVAYSPVGRGFLTGQIKRFEDLPQNDFRRIVPRFQGENFAENLKLVDEVTRIAHAKNATASQVALAWLLARGPHVIPIPGTTKVKHLEENVAAEALQFSTSEWAEVDAVLARFEAKGLRYPAEMMGAIDTAV